MNTLLLLAILALQIFTVYYLIRSARNLGSKTTRYQKDLMENINMMRASARSNLVNPESIPNSSEFKALNWDYVISLTSHPARFSTLTIALDQCLNQILIPKQVYLNIAQSDISQLPDEVRKLESGGVLKIIPCEDLGPGKKLIPTLKQEANLPIIVVDDDLYFEADLTMQLMIQHHLAPRHVIASRVHKISYEKDGRPCAYSKWVKNYSLSNGPAEDLFPTSGAGTLYKKEFFHPDVVDTDSYKKFAFHTDDLWWYIQSKRVGVISKRLPGYNKLEFIKGTQESGLWSNGNQDRNDINLKNLMKKYSL
jgi:hypothetical protein